MAGNMEIRGHMSVQDRLRERMVHCLTHLFKVTEHTRTECLASREILSLSRMLRGELRQHPDISDQVLDTCNKVVELAAAVQSEALSFESVNDDFIHALVEQGVHNDVEPWWAVEIAAPYAHFGRHGDVELDVSSECVSFLARIAS